MAIKPFGVVRAWMAIATLVAILGLLWRHEPVPALPEFIPEGLERYSNADFRLGAVEAVRDIVSLMTAIAFGLSAVVGYTIRNGLGKNNFCELLRTAATAGFIYLITSVFVAAYDCYATIAIQLDSGYVFIGRLEQSINIQTHSLVGAAVLALLLLLLSLPRTPGRSGETLDA